MENWKKTIIQGAICVGLLCVIWGGYFLVKTYHTDRILDIKEDDFSWVYQVDSVKTEGKDFVLQGFAFKLDKNAEEGTFEIVLADTESGKRYFPKMEYMERTDVNEYFLCEYDYIKSGFEATINAGKLDLEEKNYEVLLRVAGERQTYQTGTYISKGTLMYANPTEFQTLDVEGTGLENIVENGVLRVYRPDYGMYVYQYEGALYWIAESSYDFVDGNARLQLQLFTTQQSNLPKESIVSNKGIGELSFWFLDYEVTDLNLGNWRVAKKELSTECSISKLQTGNWKSDVEWIWKEEFYPRYEFVDED